MYFFVLLCIFVKIGLCVKTHHSLLLWKLHVPPPFLTVEEER